MLVKLTSSTSGEVLMFAEHAHHLFEAIGKACTARGVFSKEQLPDAIAALRRVVEDKRKNARARGSDEQQADTEEGDEEEAIEAEELVALGQRAVPLIQLMEWTLKEEGFILWEAPNAF